MGREIFHGDEAETGNCSSDYGNPGILVLDEPMNALDEEGVEEI